MEQQEFIKPQLHISVRNLVEFVLRNGDIDDRRSGKNPLSAMQEGRKIHQKIQGKMKPNYHPEVPLSFCISYDDYDLMIEGRADGIIYDDELSKESSVCVDEIKGTYGDLELLEEPLLVHLAQAKCYAYFLCEEYSLSSIDVQLTYCNMDTYEVKRFLDHYRAKDLYDWFYDVISLYKRWSDFTFYFKKIRQESIKELKFPFPYREGQKEMVEHVYRSIHQNGLLFAQAPTGSGKTIATIFPALKAIGEGDGERIFYLTAKTITRTVAKDTFLLLGKNGYRGKTVIITAKDKMCPLEERKCNPKDCPYAKGHFDRINDAIYDLLQMQDMFDAPDILDFAKERMVCPFELNLDLSSWSDNVICDYNYVFDPNVYLKRFFSEGNRSEGIFLVDESHNLIERGREMYSETLIKEDFLKIKKYFKVYQGGITKGLDKCNKDLLVWKRMLSDAFMYLDDMDAFVLHLMNLCNAFERFFEKGIEVEHMDEVLEFYFKLRNFINLTEGLDGRYRIYVDYNDKSEFCIHMFCVDPSYQLQQRIEKANSVVFFSATLLPLRYYIKLLCTKENPFAIYVDSIFPKKNRKIMIGRDVTSKYKNRNKDQYKNIASYIYEVTKQKNGNYMIFAPSYSFMENVIEAYRNYFLQDETIIEQKSYMTETQREEFLEAFQSDHETTLLGFCVLGGIFSEGIDLTGECLIGSIVIGTGLPQISNERKIISDYFDAIDGNGFYYSYLYPGMNKVMQAAGRVIRTMEDKGVVGLLDERFLHSEYKNTFPKEWDDCTSVTKETVGKCVFDFWKNSEK